MLDNEPFNNWTGSAPGMRNVEDITLRQYNRQTRESRWTAEAFPQGFAQLRPDAETSSCASAHLVQPRNLQSSGAWRGEGLLGADLGVPVARLGDEGLLPENVVIRDTLVQCQLAASNLPRGPVHSQVASVTFRKHAPGLKGKSLRRHTSADERQQQVRCLQGNASPWSIRQGPGALASKS